MTDRASKPCRINSRSLSPTKRINARGVVLAMQQDQAMHAGLGETARFVAVDPAARCYAYLEFLEPPSGRFARSLESLDMLPGGREVEREAVPSLARRAARENASLVCPPKTISG